MFLKNLDSLTFETKMSYYVDYEKYDTFLRDQRRHIEGELNITPPKFPRVSMNSYFVQGPT